MIKEMKEERSKLFVSEWEGGGQEYSLHRKRHTRLYLKLEQIHYRRDTVVATMRIDRRGFLAAASAASVLAKNQLSLAAPNRPSLSAGPFSVAGKEVSVYTTAE